MGSKSFDVTEYVNGVITKQSTANVHDTAPTQAEMTTAFGGAASTKGRGWFGTIDDNDGDAISYICWATDASYYYVKGTKGA